MRLIDADTMKESFETNCKEINKFMMDLIDNQPTAYDVDKVMEKLKISSYTNDGGFEYEDVDVVTLSDAIEIMKAGGKDE